MAGSSFPASDGLRHHPHGLCVFLPFEASGGKRTTITHTKFLPSPALHTKLI